MSIKMRMPKLASVRGQTLLTDNKPYLFRQSPVVAQMLDLTLTGGTVAWNQLVQNGDFSDGTNHITAINATIEIVSDGSLKVTASASFGGVRFGNTYADRVPRTQGHRYLMTVVAKGNAGGERLGVNDAAGFNAWLTQSLTTSFERYSTVTTANATAANAINVFTYSAGDVFFVKSFVTIDLTQMFGSTIADYVYSLEQGHAGDGIAWLQSYGFFTEDYYPYDAGSLLSVKTSGHKVTGKNLADLSFMEFDDTAYTHSFFQTNAQTVALAETLNKLRGQTVFYSVETTGTASGQAIGQFRFFAGIDLLIRFNPNESTTVPDVDFTQFTSMTVYGSTTGASVGKLQIERGSTATAYEPYSPTVYPLSDIDLRGIPKLTGGNIVYDGDTYESSGTVTRKWKVADLGSLSWNADANRAGVFHAGVADKQVGKADDPSVNGLVCAKYAYRNAIVSTSVDKYISDYPSYGGKNIFVRDTAYATASDFKTAMSGVQFIYQVATETTETTDAFENPQISGTTEEYIDTRTVPMPVGHVTEYFNMIQKEQIQMHMGQAQAIKMHMPKGD